MAVAEAIAGQHWLRLSDGLAATCCEAELVDLFNDMVATAMTGRLVRAASSLVDLHGHDSPLYESQLGRFVRSTMRLGNHTDKIERLTKQAEANTRKNFNATELKHLRAWAMRAHPHCYMCGVVLDFSNAEVHDSYTLDHIWPRSYGGNSDEENALPACHSCNSGKKSGFASWSLVGALALCLGLQPNSSRLTEIDGRFKFALHHRAARHLAARSRQSLKRSLLLVGKWQEPSLINLDDVGHFFNICNTEQP